VANLLPQHFFESSRFNKWSHLVAKQENITCEKQVRKFCRQSISLMLCGVLLHAVNLRHGTDGFTSPPKEVRARDFYHFCYVDNLDNSEVTKLGLNICSSCFAD
jgi:hypothetical protein